MDRLFIGVVFWISRLWWLFLLKEFNKDFLVRIVLPFFEGDYGKSSMNYWVNFTKFKLFLLLAKAVESFSMGAYKLSFSLENHPDYILSFMCLLMLFRTFSTLLIDSSIAYCYWIIYLSLNCLSLDAFSRRLYILARSDLDAIILGC